MTLDNWLAFTGLVLTAAGLVFVALQMRDGNRQEKLKTQIRLYDINRELIAMGFSDAELFKVLEDSDKVCVTKERRYLQLWLNLLCLIDSFKRNGVFETEVQDSFEIDFRDMMLMKNMRRHWGRFKKYYPTSFQKSVDDLFAEVG